jgi:hypothetical protein
MADTRRRAAQILDSAPVLILAAIAGTCAARILDRVV